MNQTVTFDFDGTLSRPHVQEYALELLDRGLDVWVVTSRYNNLCLAKHNNSIGTAHWDNNDLWTVVDKLGIPRWKVVFTNMEHKANFLDKTNVVWHLDDDFYELSQMRAKKCKTIGIQVSSSSWKKKCEKILNQKI